jgi:HAD superfamily phosphatase (TIGR01668 family)
MIFSSLQPDLILGGNILQLNKATLDLHQIKGLVLDVDDTIIPIKTTQVQPELIEWLAEIRKLTKLWLVSNNPNRQRIEAIAESLEIPYLLSAGKPSRKKLRQAVDDMNLPYREIAMVGDRIFTDVLAGNRLGIFTILVDPIAANSSTSSFHFLRQIEFSIARLTGVSLQQKLINPHLQKYK